MYVILQVFGLWLPPAKGRSGTPAVATKSWYKKKNLFITNKKTVSLKQAIIYIDGVLDRIFECRGLT